MSIQKTFEPLNSVLDLFVAKVEMAEPLFAEQLMALELSNAGSVGVAPSSFAVGAEVAATSSDMAAVLVEPSFVAQVVAEVPSSWAGTAPVELFLAVSDADVEASLVEHDLAEPSVVVETLQVA